MEAPSHYCKLEVDCPPPCLALVHVTGRDCACDRLQCNYPRCGKRFKHRQQLFNHLNRMIGKTRMIHSYHTDHMRLREQHVTVDYSTLTCPACGEVFDDRVLSFAAIDAQLLYAAPSHWVCTI
jgi:uncharacterized C2H2 Zn-finger protein